MKRALAHIEKVEWVRPIEGADNIELIGILGWSCIAKKGEFKENDTAVYIEIDSLCPTEDKRFEFLASKGYKVKTMKLNKFKVISQGLALPITLFPELQNKMIGDDVTKDLKITYYSPEDRQRKSSGNKENKKTKYNRMISRLAAKHPRLFNTKLIKYLIRCDWGKELLFVFFGNKNDTPKDFPIWIQKSDQCRCENMPWILDKSKEPNEKLTFEVSEKLDGTSCSYGVKRIRNKKYDYAVCSRNVRQIDKDNIPFDTNVYHEMSDKYGIQNILLDFVIDNDLDCIYIQGECIGDKIQGNPYKFKTGERDLYLFEIVIDGVKQSYEFIENWCKDHGMKSVPLLYKNYELPDTMEELKNTADGYSKINSKVKREGFVYRNVSNPSMTFKNVSNDYLLKHS